MRLTESGEVLSHAPTQPDELVFIDPGEVEIPPSPEPAIKNSDRVAWLEQAYRVLREELLPEAPERITICFGFPSTQARRQNGSQRIGEYADSFMRGLPDCPINSGLISLHPTIFKDPAQVMSTLLHEMLHSATPGDGHRGRFPKLAKRVGLIGKMTSTVRRPGA